MMQPKTKLSTTKRVRNRWDILYNVTELDTGTRGRTRLLHSLSLLDYGTASGIWDMLCDWQLTGHRLCDWIV